MLRRTMLAGGTCLLTNAISAELNKVRVENAVALIQQSVASGDTAAAARSVRQGSFIFDRSFGQAKSPDSVFLLASITKPMTATGLMILVDRGELSISDPVQKFIPEFSGGDRRGVTVWHLLTHTSGLPDQLPENVELRKRHAPLKDFV